jgi:glycosyltransferase involved in cell wall biosynthesis
VTRILLLSSYEPPPDGIAKHSSHLVHAWDSAGHSVLVLSPGKQRGLAEAEHTGANSKISRVLRLTLRRRTWDEIVTFEPDIVIVQFAIAALSVNLWPVLSILKRFSHLPIPVVVTYHEPAREYNLIGPVTRRIYRAVARGTDVPIVFTSAGRQALIESGLFDDAAEVPLGTAGVTEISNDDISRVKDRYLLREPLVLTLGFTNFDKGADVLIDAASAISEVRGNNVQFLIAGSPRTRRGVLRLMGRRDLKCQRQLERRAQGLPHVNIAFSGYVAPEDVAALLFVADVVVLPYRRITQSGVANLALSSRSVIVSSDLPGLRSDLGDAAKYVAVGDARAMAEQIASLLGDENAPNRQRMRGLSGERAAANTYATTANDILSAGLAHRDTGTSY